MIQPLTGFKPLGSKSDSARPLSMRHTLNHGGHQVDCSMTAGQLLGYVAETQVSSLILTYRA